MGCTGAGGSFGCRHSIAGQYDDWIMAGRRSASYDLELTCALTAARAVGERLKTEFHRGFPLEVDRELDVSIREQLTASFPRYGYLGEEVGFTSPQDEVHMWVVDPQDGTGPPGVDFEGRPFQSP